MYFKSFIGWSRDIKTLHRDTVDENNARVGCVQCTQADMVFSSQHLIPIRTAVVIHRVPSMPLSQ
jgi:hypothetical protein